MMLLCYSLKVLNICYIGGCSDAFKSPKYTVGEVTKATHKCEREELKEGRRGKEERRRGRKEGSEAGKEGNRNWGQRRGKGERGKRERGGDSMRRVSVIAAAEQALVPYSDKLKAEGTQRSPTALPFGSSLFYQGNAGGDLEC